MWVEMYCTYMTLVLLHYILHSPAHTLMAGSCHTWRQAARQEQFRVKYPAPAHASTWKAGGAGDHTANLPIRGPLYLSSHSRPQWVNFQFRENYPFKTETWHICIHSYKHTHTGGAVCFFTFSKQRLRGRQSSTMAPLSGLCVCLLCVGLRSQHVCDSLSLCVRFWLEWGLSCIALLQPSLTIVCPPSASSAWDKLL